MLVHSIRRARSCSALGVMFALFWCSAAWSVGNGASDTRVAELEAQFAVCLVLDQLELTQAQMEKLLECRAQYAPHARRYRDDLSKWVANTGPWEEYDRIAATGNWPGRELIVELQELHAASTRLPHPMINAMNPLADAWARTLLDKQRRRLRDLGTRRFPGCQHVAAARAPEDLRRGNLTPKDRSSLLHMMELVGVPSRAAKVAMAPYLEEALAKRYERGIAGMEFQPQSCPGDALRFPAAWDFALASKVRYRDAYFVCLTTKTGAKLSLDQVVAIHGILEKQLPRAGNKAGARIDYGSCSSGRKYVRDLQRAVKRQLQGRPISWDDVAKLVALRDRLDEDVWWYHNPRAQAAVRTAGEQIKDVLTTAQRVSLAGLAPCPVPYLGQGTVLAGQVTDDMRTGIASILREIRSRSDWGKGENDSLREKCYRRLCRSEYYDRLPEREREEAYAQARKVMTLVVDEARSLSDGDYLAQESRLVGRLAELDIHAVRRPSEGAQTGAADEARLDRCIRNHFVGGNMLSACRKHIASHRRSEASSRR